MGTVNNYISKILKMWKIALAIFVVQLIFSLLAYWFVSSLMDDALGSSINYSQLTAGFDRTVIMDMINNNALSTTAVSSFMMLMIAVWCIVTTYLNAGSIACIAKEEYQLKDFYKAAGKYMPKFLVLNAVLMLITAVVAAILIIPLAWYVGDPLDTFDTERPLVWIVIIASSFMCLIFVLFWILIFRAKALIVKSSIGVWAALKASYRATTFKKTLSSIALIIAFVIGVCIVAQIRSITAYDIDVSSLWLIVSIALGHVLAFVVVWLRLLFFQGLVGVEN